jgi:cellulose synthase/poly-beta-1,6-N-acetylglucosamine synthase-like glycosyltransferase
MNHDDKKNKILTETPFVTITIPAYNEQDSLAGTVHSVLALDYPKEKYELLIVDDGSTDTTAHIAQELITQHPSYTIRLISQQNQGKGAALNNALRQAQGIYFVCLDADSFVARNALQKMLPHFTDAKVAAVLPALKIHNPKNKLEKLQWYEYIINMFYKELMGKLNCVHVTPGPFSVYRTATLREIGYFDEHNITEDLEIALRLQSHNYTIVQLMDPEVLTIGPSTMKELYTQRNRWFKGATLNVLKYRKMLFNKQYGDFGFMQMPTVLLSGVIAIILFCTALYYGLKPYVENVYYLTFVQFDFMPFLTHFQFNFTLMDLNYITIFVAATMLIISVYIMRKSEVRTNERLLKYGFLTITIYMLFYFLFLGAVWVGVFYDIIRQKKQQW